MPVLIKCLCFVIMLGVGHEGILSGTPWFIEKTKIPAPSSRVNVGVVYMSVNIDVPCTAFSRFLENGRVVNVYGGDIIISWIYDRIRMTGANPVTCSRESISIIEINRKKVREFHGLPIHLNVDLEGGRAAVILVGDEHNVSPGPAQVAFCNPRQLLNVSEPQFYLANSDISPQLPLSGFFRVADQSASGGRQTPSVDNQKNGGNRQASRKPDQPPIVRRFFVALSGLFLCLIFSFYGSNYEGTLKRSALIGLGVVCGLIGMGLWWGTMFPITWGWPV